MKIESYTDWLVIGDELINLNHVISFSFDKETNVTTVHYLHGKFLVSQIEGNWMKEIKREICHKMQGSI